MMNLYNEMHKGKYMPYVGLYTSDDGQDIELEATVCMINSDDVRGTPLHDLIMHHSGEEVGIKFLRSPVSTTTFQQLL